MKKLLYTIHKHQEGSILVYLMYILAVISLVTISMIQSYSTTMELSLMEVEQIKLESIQQIAYRSIIDDIDHFETPTQVEYHFPIGQAYIRMTPIDESSVRLLITAETDLAYQKLRIYTLPLPP